MSNGDDAAEDESADEPESEDNDDIGDDGFDSVEAFEERLERAADALEAAETEADLDDVEATLEKLEDDLEAATFEVEEPEDEDEEPDDPTDELEDELASLEDELEEQRGPYVEDITAVVDDAKGTIETSEWTVEGGGEIQAVVEAFFDDVESALNESFSLDGETPEEVADAVGEVNEYIGDQPLDPDEDADTIAALLDAAETLTDGLEDSTVWSDLPVREQLDRQDFYDVLDPENRKDFPPELTAVKIYADQGNAEPLLAALETLGSDFMEENVLDVLEHFAPTEAFDPIHQLAQRRNVKPVRILGRMGDERACDTLHNFLGGGDIALEKTTLRSLGAIGSEESTEPVAQRLLAENAGIRVAAARALGLIGDTRAVEPLAEVLESDEADEVRASAAWALNQIGTERALEVAANFTDDRSYLVQVEAEKAVSG